MKVSSIVNLLNQSEENFYSLYKNIKYGNCDELSIIDYLLRTENYDLLIKLMSPMSCIFNGEEKFFMVIDPFGKNKDVIWEMISSVYSESNRIKTKLRYLAKLINQNDVDNSVEYNSVIFNEMFNDTHYLTHSRGVVSRIKESVYNCDYLIAERMNLSDIYPRAGLNKKISIKTQEDIISNVELPCVKACLFLFYKEIKPIYTACDINNSSRNTKGFCSIGIKMSELTVKNREFADYLIEHGLAYINSSNEDELVIQIEVNMNNKVYDISEKLAAICVGFDLQKHINRRK